MFVERGKPRPDVGFDLVGVVVLEPGLLHFTPVEGERLLHPLVLVDERVLRVVVGGSQLLGLEDLLGGLAGAAAGLREVLGFERHGEGRVSVLAQQGLVVGGLVGRRERLEVLHIALAETDFRRAVAGRELGRQAGVQRRDTEAITAHELRLREPGHLLVGGHAGAHGRVVDGDVFEALLAHAFCDQLLGALDGLDQFALREPEFFRAQAGRRLCRTHGRGEQHNQCRQGLRDGRRHQSSVPSTWPVSMSTKTSFSPPPRGTISTT